MAAEYLRCRVNTMQGDDWRRIANSRDGQKDEFKFSSGWAIDHHAGYFVSMPNMIE